MVSGASTPIKSSDRAITDFVAVTSPSRKRLRVGAEHLVMVVEAVEVVGEPDRVGRDRVRPPPLGRLGDDAGNSARRLIRSRSSSASSAGGSAEGVASPALRRIPAIRACAYWT